jgi:hypothetical protein
MGFLPFSPVALAPRVEVVTQQRDLNRAKPPQGRSWAESMWESLLE